MCVRSGCVAAGFGSKGRAPIIVRTPYKQCVRDMMKLIEHVHCFSMYIKCLPPFFHLPTEDPLDRGYDRTSKSSTPHHTSSIPAPPSKRTSIPHKKTPFSPSTNSTQPSTAQRLGETDGSGTNPSPEYQPSPMHERQLSSASLEHSLQELDRNLQDMLMESGEKDSKAHVVEWLRQTSEDALPPDVLAEQDMQLASPISTDHSFNYSPVSLCDRDMVLLPFLFLFLCMLLSIL